MNGSITTGRTAISFAHLALFAVMLGGTQLSAQSAGIANVSKLANDGFDVYTAYPSPSMQQWLRDHYSRMTVYSPYFDSRTSWYSRGDAYINLYGIQRGTQLQYDHPEWILKDPSGNWLSIPWGCGGGTCPLWAADVSNQDYRNWWISRARSIISKGYHGLWIDDVNMEFRVSDSWGNQVAPYDRNNGQVMSWDNWRRYMAEFLEQIRGGLPGAEIVHNSIWYAGPSGLRDSDPYIQRQISAADIVNIEHGIGSDPGLTGGNGMWSVNALLGYIDRVHSRGRAVTIMEFSTNRPAQEFALAGYFMVSNGKDLISDYATNPDNWWNGYNVNLGTPLGSYSYSNGLYRRDFSAGVVLMVEPGGASRTVNVGSGYTNVDGNPVQSVTLGGHGGAVLLKPGGVAPAAAPPSSGQQYVSDLNWTSATSGWGPIEKDRSNAELSPTDGNPIRIRGTQYAKGLGAHSYSEVHYAIGGRCSALTATVGVDDEVPTWSAASVVFQVWADGTKLYDSGRVTRNSAPLTVGADLSGRYDLSLIIQDAGDGKDYDHADWADAKLTCTP
jgi:hypothetical protein